MRALAGNADNYDVSTERRKAISIRVSDHGRMLKWGSPKGSNLSTPRVERWWRFLGRHSEPLQPTTSVEIERQQRS